VEACGIGLAHGSNAQPVRALYIAYTYTDRVAIETAICVTCPLTADFRTDEIIESTLKATIYQQTLISER